MGGKLGPSTAVSALRPGCNGVTAMAPVLCVALNAVCGISSMLRMLYTRYPFLPQWRGSSIEELGIQWTTTS